MIMKKISSFLFFLLPAFAFAQSSDTCKVSVPNAISHNSENIKWENKLQVFHDCEIKEFKICIYDRWGEPLLKDARLEEGDFVKWNCEKLAGGVYVYLIHCKQLIDGSWVARSFTGSITLIN
jgi:hypothetical protein